MVEAAISFRKILETTRVPQTETFTSRLVYGVSSRHFTPEEEVKKLEGNKVLLLGFHHETGYERTIIGRVIDVEDRRMTVLPEYSHTYYSSGNEKKHAINGAEHMSVSAYLVTNDPFQTGAIGEGPEVKDAVFCAPPGRISILDSDGQEIVSIDAIDPELNRFLDEAMSLFPKIESGEDLKRLTSWVNSKIPFNHNGKIPSIYRLPSLGSRLLSDRIVCAEKAGLEFAILELNGIQTIPIGSEFDGEKHLYLAINVRIEDGQTVPIFVDPTWDLVGTYKDINMEILERDMELGFHLPQTSRALKVVPDWSYKAMQ